MSSSEREQFEAFVRAQPGGTDYVLRRADFPDSAAFGRYVDPRIEFAWQSWQAARRAQASAEPVAWRWNTSPEFPEWAVTHDPEKAERVRRHGIGVEPLYLGASPQQAPLTDEQKPPTESRIAELVRYRFASTNRTDAFGMYTYWYEKGVLDGWEEFKRGITAAKEST